MSHLTVRPLLVLLIITATLLMDYDHVLAINDPVKPLPYTRQELLTRDIRDTYEGDHLQRVAFPLGGIGTGCVSLSGTGKLIDWEIFNNPNKGFQPRYSFLSLWAQAEGQDPVFKVLEGQLTERLDGPMYLADNMWYLGNGGGPQQTQAAGLPRMRRCMFTGRFPFAKVSLKDKGLPVDVEIEGWSPFIPNNDKDSSIPAAILTVKLHNTTSKPVDVTLGFNVQNCAGDINEVIREPGFNCLYLHDGEDNGKSMFVATADPVTTWQTNWLEAGEWVTLEHFRRTFALLGEYDQSGDPILEPELSERHMGTESQNANNPNHKVGSLGVKKSILPGETYTTIFVLGWYFPIFDTAKPHEIKNDSSSWRNYYAQTWGNGLDVARYVINHFNRLERQTRLFQTTFFSSTLPGVVLEAISSQLSVLRSPTLIRHPDGTLYGWEGCAINERLGFGTCNHVWHYQQAIPFLFPHLQRTILENFFFNGLRESDGAVQFRMPANPGAQADMNNVFAAADGQFGLVCQVYREWQISGDDEWLTKIWPAAKKALEYAWVQWDKDRDGLLEGSHHNTLDLNLTTPNSFCGSVYQAALLVGQRIATYLGDVASAKEYRRIYESGKKLTDEKLFNGEYYQQILPYIGDYQLGTGCISEQLVGQIYTAILDLEDVYDQANLHQALGSLFKYNYFEDFYDFTNVFRAYSVGQDRGLVIATWPHGGRPETPLLYCDETMSGFEYQVAGNLLYEDYLLEGLTVIKSIRDRHDGRRRNPFNEFEWGNHYVRTMANYSSLLALSGFHYSAVEKSLSIAPKIYADDFRGFFSIDGGWGIISQKKEKKVLHASIEMAMGKIELFKLVFQTKGKVEKISVQHDEKQVRSKFSITKSEVEIRLGSPLTITPARPLVVNLYLSPLD